MSANLQLICFLASFLYGVIFGLLSKLHFKLISKYHQIFQLLISIVFVIDIVLGYILIMYHLNLGIFHIYFLIFIFLGFISSIALYVYIKNIIKNKFKKIYKNVV